MTVGLNHFMLVDIQGKLWACGDNKFGCLGNDDNHVRTTPILNRFFLNKRIIDIACGDSFSVVIAEKFHLSAEELEAKFDYRLMKKQVKIPEKKMRIESFKSYVQSDW